MNSAKSPKGLKLLQLRDRLAKLSGQPNLINQRQKLSFINQQNKMIEKEISSIFDSISEYFFKSQEKVLSIGKQLRVCLQQMESSLLGQLQSLKQSQLDAIKQDVDGYLKFKKNIKGLVDQIDTCKGDSRLIQSINKLQPFSAQPIKHKINYCHIQISEIDKKIDQFSNLMQRLSFDTLIKMGQEKIKNQFEMRIDLEQKQFTEQSKKSANGGHSKLFQLVRKQIQNQKGSASEKQENLMDFANDFRSETKISKISQSLFRPNNEQQLDGRTQKYALPKRAQTPKLSRKQSHPTIPNHGTKTPQNLLQNFSKRGLQQKSKFRLDINMTQSSEMIGNEIKFCSFSRVKSEQNINLKMTRMATDNMEINLSKSKLRVNNFSSIASPSLSQNRLRDSKSSRNGGGWAKILQDQQFKYNQLRMKIKN